LNSGGPSRLLQALPHPPPPSPPRNAVGDHAKLATGWAASPPELPLPCESAFENPPSPDLQPSPQTHPQEVDPFYLFACHLEWEKREEPSAAWELLAAAQSSHPDTRAHARALLASSHHLGGLGAGSGYAAKKKRSPATETDMTSPHDLEMNDNCMECTNPTQGFFCGLSPTALQLLNEVSHKSTLPAGAILFVEGQSPRGMFILCSGRVNLSTTSREGKTIITKISEPGDVLGLNAVISSRPYEVTAETMEPGQANFIPRDCLLQLLKDFPEVAVRVAQQLSRNYYTAYEEIRTLGLAASPSEKFAKLLLTWSSKTPQADGGAQLKLTMTHEEIGEIIGTTRETVSRLFSEFRKKQLFQMKGATLVIRSLPALEKIVQS